MRFAATPFPNAGLMAAVEQLPPFSPFNTTAYATAMQSLGAEPYILTLDDGRGAGCLGMLRLGRFSAAFTIPSLSRLTDPAPFFEGLQSFCRARSVWDLEITTFGSDWKGAIPVVGTELSRRPRWEFVASLSDGGGLDLSTNHRRNAIKAERAGVVCRRTRDPSAVAVHVAASHASMERRTARGEVVDASQIGREASALLQSQAAELFQAVHEGVVVSSLLVVRSARVAYYHSAGTTPDGMRLGASPLLVSWVAATLAGEGVAEFNLGGAEPTNAGLYRFKEGFGADVRELEALSCSVVASWRRRVRAVLRWIARV
jgi:hypothetical protein